MELKYLFILFVCCVLCFGVYFVSERFIDPDSYHYINGICNNGVVDSGSSELFNLLITFFPCNFFIIKLFLLLLFFCSALVFSKIGLLFDNKIGWLLGFMFVSFTWALTDFWKFENDSIGYLFCFVAIYFLLKLSFKHRFFDFSTLCSRDFYLSLLFILLGGLFWKGAIYWLMVFCLFSVFFIPLFLFLFIIYFNNFWVFLNYGDFIAEGARWVGLIWLGITTVFLIGFIKTDKKIVFSYLLLLIPCLFISKLFMLAVPFALIISFNGIKLLVNNNRNIIIGTIVFSLLICFSFGNMTVKQMPTMSDVDLVKKAILLDKNIQNTFGAGYVIEFYGGFPSSKGGTDGHDYDEKGIVLTTSWTDTNNNCFLIEKSDGFSLFNCNRYSLNIIK